MINVPEFVDGKKLNVAVAKLLLENNLKISVAESLTGGEVAAKLVDVAGFPNRLSRASSLMQTRQK